MRLGIPPYLNCLPLVYGFPCEIYKSPPSTLIQKAKEDDIILAPIVTAFLDPQWYVLEGVGIGSIGPVHTVKFFMKENKITPQNIKRIYIDPDSQTSVALLKVLLANVYQRNLNEIEFSHDKNEKVEGKLLIGDKVWDYSNDHSFLDLGQCWSEWTGQPFVYACWMTKNLILAKEWKEKLISQAKQNLKALEKISQEVAPDKAEKILNYWQALCFELGPFQKNGIALFHSLWAKIENKPVLKLLWI